MVSETYISFISKLQKLFNFFGFKLQNKRIIKIRIDRPSLQYFYELKKGSLITGVELGAWKGDNAEKIYRLFNIKKLYLVDAWDSSITKEGILRDQYDFNNIKIKVLGRFAFNKEIKIIDDFSVDAINKIKEKVDFVYIDTSHDYETTRDELRLYFPIVKKGGMIAGHDIENRPEKENGVFKAVSEFALKNNLKVYLKSPDWWIMK